MFLSLRLDSYLKNEMASLMHMLEKVAPAAGFPEVYSLMKRHHLDKKMTDMAMMVLDLLKRSGITCNNSEDNKRIRYIMGKSYYPYIHFESC